MLIALGGTAARWQSGRDARRAEVQRDTGFYEYEKDGHKVQMNKDDVKTIEEVK